MRFIMSFAFASLLLMGLVYLFYPHSTMPQLHKLSSGRLAILLSDFLEPFSSVHFAQTKCSLLYKMTKRKVIFSSLHFSEKFAILFYDVCQPER